MNKPMLLTMTQNRSEDISIMLQNIYPVFDGVVAVLNEPSHDNTLEILEKNKGNGKIIRRDFVPNHAFLMNETLFCGKIQNGQYCLWLDSPESCTDDFVNLIPDLLKSFDKDQVGALFWDDRPYIFRYNPYMEFYGAYHWGLSGISGNRVTIQDKDKYIINRRNNNPEISYCFNGSKSYLCYPLSNEVNMMYEKYGPDIVRKEERRRREIRAYIQNVLGINLTTLNELISYFKLIAEKVVIPNDYLIETIEEQYRLSELFQLKVLNQPFMDVIAAKRYRWSFKKYLECDNGFADPNYRGQILLYNERFHIT